MVIPAHYVITWVYFRLKCFFSVLAGVIAVATTATTTTNQQQTSDSTAVETHTIPLMLAAVSQS